MGGCGHVRGQQPGSEPEKCGRPRDQGDGCRQVLRTAVLARCALVTRPALDRSPGARAPRLRSTEDAARLQSHKNMGQRASLRVRGCAPLRCVVDGRCSRQTSSDTVVLEVASVCWALAPPHPPCAVLAAQEAGHCV